LSETVAIEIKHYRDTILLNTFTLQLDFARPATDSYMLALAAGQDDQFMSVRTSDDSRFDWALDWQLGNHCCYVNCKPYRITNANPLGVVPLGQTPIYDVGKPFQMIVPLWDANMTAPIGNYWIPGIGYGWKAWRVESVHDQKPLPLFKGFKLNDIPTNGSKKWDFQDGVVMGYDFATRSYLVKVSDSQSRWAMADDNEVGKRVKA